MIISTAIWHPHRQVVHRRIIVLTYRRSTVYLAERREDGNTVGDSVKKFLDVAQKVTRFLLAAFLWGHALFLISLPSTVLHAATRIVNFTAAEVTLFVLLIVFSFIAGAVVQEKIKLIRRGKYPVSRKTKGRSRTEKEQNYEEAKIDCQLSGILVSYKIQPSRHGQAPTPVRLPLHFVAYPQNQTARIP
jgi:hypothetical protein